VTVRRLTEQDIDPVVAIEEEAFSTPWRHDTFENLVGRPGLELLVMEDRVAGIIGYAVLWCILDQGELANMAVASAFRGRGLGRYLLSRVLQIAKERGVETVYLEVRASNERAARLYAGFGFTEIGIRRDYYERPREDARVLRLGLA